MSFAELMYWAESANWGPKRRNELSEYLRRFSIVHSNQKICEIWSSVVAEGRQNGRIIAGSDAWVASAAMFLRIPLVTHNASDFEGVSGLDIISVSKL